MAEQRQEEEGLAKKMADMLQCAKYRYDYVRFVMTNMYGVSNCRLIPKAELDKFFEEGPGVFVCKYRSLVGLLPEFVCNEKSMPQFTPLQLHCALTEVM